MHRLYVGTTGCGKTHKAIEAVDTHIKGGGRVIVFNPLKQNFNTRAERYTSPEVFYQAVNNTQEGRALIVVDEIPILLDYSKDKFNNFITHARHYGVVLMLVQRPRVVMSQTLFSQCSSAVVFALSLEADRQWVEKNIGISVVEQKALYKKTYDYIYCEF